MSEERPINVGGRGGGVDQRAGRRGLFLAGCSAFLVSVSSLASKICSQVPAGQLFFICSLATSSVGLCAAVCQGQGLFPRGRRKRLACYSLAGAQAWMASYQAVRLMPLSDEALLVYASIPFTVLLARLFLNENCGPYELISCLLVVLGVLLVSRPTLDRQGYPYYFWGVLIALYGSFCDSINYIALKGLRGVGLGVLLFNLGVSSLAVSSLSLGFENWVVPGNARAVFTVVSLFVMFEVYYTLSMETEPAGLIALVEASDIVFAYMWELIFFDERYDALKICGSALIISVICFSVCVHKSS